MPDAKVNVLLVLKDQLTASLNGVGNGMKKFGDSFRRNWLAIGASIFIVKRAIESLIVPSIEFETAFAGVKKTVDATNAEFKELEENLLEMSRRIPVAAKELAGIQEIAGQLGIKGVKSLTKFTEAIAKISVSTNLSQQSAAINFSRIASVINEPILNIEKMASAVVGLGNNFEVQEDEILNFAQRISAMGKLAKLTAADIFGVSAAFASVGVRAEAGGTAVNKVLLELTKQGKTGSEALVNFVKELQGVGDKAAQKLEELGFAEARTQRAFLSLAGAGDKLEVALTLANDEFERGNALNIEAAKRFETTASKITLIKNNIVILQKEIGDKLIPAFEKLLKVTKEYVDFATGADLEVTKLQVLEEALKKIDVQLSGRGGGTEGFFGAMGGFAEETMEIGRRRTVLVGLIVEEKTRLQVLEEQIRLEEELANLPIQGAKNKTKDVEEFNSQMNAMAKKALSLEKAMSAAFSRPLAGLISGAITAKEAFAQMGSALIGILAKFIAETIVSFTIGKTLQKLATIFSATQAAILAQAWAPAAIFASIATGGGAAIAGLAGVTGAMGTVAALTAAISATALGSSASFHKGGIIRAHNGLAVGEVPIIAQTGEGILSRRGMGALGGESQLNSLNQGRGGGSGGDVFVEINYPKMSTKEEVAELVRVLGFEMERQLRYARSS